MSSQDYFANNCVMCERHSWTGLHLTCCVLSWLSAVDPQWVSIADLLDAVGRTDNLLADRRRLYATVRRLRARGWNIDNSRVGYRLIRSAA